MSWTQNDGIDKIDHALESPILIAFWNFTVLSYSTMLLFVISQRLNISLTKVVRLRCYYELGYDMNVTRSSNVRIGKIGQSI
jgi:hypothetical protein